MYLKTLCSNIDLAELVITSLLAALVALGGVVIWWIKKYIKDQDHKYDIQNNHCQKIMDKLDLALNEHDECQKKLPEKFVSKSDFIEFMHMRSAEHGLINGRLLALENQQAALLSKIDVFMDDIKTKQQRLSDTFLAKEHEIAKRIDNIVINGAIK